MTAEPAPLADSPASVPLQHRFASALPELAIAWRATPPSAPRLLALNEPLARELGLDPEWLRSDEGMRVLLGAVLPDGAQPVAQAYAGHQFGMYSPRLGDGRALLLGELESHDGELRDVHLKGSGPTPFSRGGDGFAAVGQMLREYLVSEAMYALGIPTTRALAVLATGDTVLREQPLPGAVLVRVAASHLRVGTFQYARATGDLELLGRLVDHAIERHAPEAASAPIPALALFEAVVAAQARLVARWMLVGFVHGVMNTDNATISGETIDYGPCAFLDTFDVDAVFSSIDEQGRYRFRHQPPIAQWNLGRLADALLPLIDDEQERAVELATGALREFGAVFNEAYGGGMRAKIGLAHVEPGVASALADELLTLLQAAEVDYTAFFHRLSGDPERAREFFDDGTSFDEWAARWSALEPDTAEMRMVNPAVIPRNHLLEEALAAASDEGELEPFERLLEAVTHPFEVLPGLERFAEPPPRGAAPVVTFCGT